MFTLKFFRQSGEQTSLSAARYSVNTHGDRTGVWVYPTLREESPVYLDLHLEEGQTTYHELFVENQTGKTIDRHRARSFPDSDLDKSPLAA